MNTTTTLYDVLEVSEDASEATIKTAYRRLVKTAHPDSVPDDEKMDAQWRFVALQEAYETLRNDNLRAIYDSDLRAARSQPTPQKTPNSATNGHTAPGAPQQPYAPQPPPGRPPGVNTQVLRDMFPYVTDDEIRYAFQTAEAAETYGDANAFLTMLADLRQRQASRVQQPQTSAPMRVDTSIAEYARRTRERTALICAAVVGLPALIARLGLATWTVQYADPTGFGVPIVQGWEDWMQTGNRGRAAAIVVVVATVFGWLNKEAHTIVRNLYLTSRMWRTVALTAVIGTAIVSPFWLMWPDTAPIIAGIVFAAVAVFMMLTRPLWERLLAGRALNPITWTRWEIKRRWLSRRQARTHRKASR